MTFLSPAHVIFAAARAWLTIAGLVALMFGFGVERLAKRYGWSYVQKALPALVVAVVFLVLMIAEQQGLLPQLADQTLFVREFPYQPYCDGGWYWLNMLCW